MNTTNNFRYLDAEAVKPASALEKRMSSMIPSILSKTLSELSPEADIMDLFKSKMR